MDEYNAVRMKLTAEMADSANLVKAEPNKDMAVGQNLRYSFGDGTTIR